MTKHLKKLFPLSIVLLFLLISCIYSSLIPQVYAAEDSLQETGLTILNDVIDLDLTKYAIVVKEYPQESYFDVISQVDVGYTLESNVSKLKLFCTFRGETLHTLHVLEKEGSPQLTESATSVLEMAKSFLNDYQSNLGNSFYGDLGVMLDKVDAENNITLISKNIKLEVTNSGDYTIFAWSYIINDVEAKRKCVALGYKDGFLKYFIDNWDLYEIGSTSINLTEEEAIDIAMEHAKTFSWEVTVGNDTVRIDNFNVTKAVVSNLVFCDSLNSDNIRSEDLLALYPMWRIGIGLDKFYPGNVYGIYVDIWADTREVRYIQTVFTNIDPDYIPNAKIATIEESTSGALSGQFYVGETQLNSMSIIWVVLPVLAGVVLSTAPVLLSEKKKLPKLGFFTIGTVLICILLSSMMLLIPISAVNAVNPKGRATIWGSLADPKVEPEPTLQDDVCDWIKGKFESYGYVTTDYQGSDSVKANLLHTINSSEADYYRAAIVWFDHGIGGTPLDEPYDDEWHFHIVDSNNEKIYDYEIYDETWREKTFFAYISTCMSAELEIPINPDTGEEYDGTYGANTGGSGKIIGMPYAWTHGASLNYDGYDNPDAGQFCYIGFPWGSPSLVQDVDPDDYAGVTYYAWVVWFFHYAVQSDMTVNQALDQASYECFPPNYFGTTDLHLNFSAIWEDVHGGEPFPNCTMEVYGNGNLELSQKSVKVLAYDTNTDPVYSQVYIDGINVGSTGTAHWIAPGTHTIGVQNYPDPNHSFNRFIDYPSGQNPITVDVTSGTLLHAYYDYIQPQYRLTISAGTGGTTSPQPGDHYYAAGTPVQVTASNYTNYVFDHWLLDENSYDQNPITVPMDSDHTLQAIFSPTEYCLTIQSSSGGYTDPSAGNYYYPYGSYVQVTAHVDDPEWWDWSHWIVDGQPSSTNLTITIPIDGDHTIKPVFIFNPPERCLTIINWYGSYTVPSAGSYYYDEGTLAQVTAYVDDPQYWEWSHWELDGEYYSSNTHVTIVMNSDHTLRPICTYKPPIEYHDLTIEVWAWVGGWICLYSQTESLAEDSYMFTAPQIYYGLNFVYWYYEGDYYYSNTITIFLDSDQYLAALYTIS